MSDACTSPATTEQRALAQATDSPAQSPEVLRAALEGLEEELFACQRLALLGGLTAMVAHEFNNLLTPIVARVEAALAGGDGAFMRQTLERTLAQAQRAMSVTRHLLDLAQAKAPPTQTCLLAAVVRDALETLTRPLDKDGIRLHVCVPEDLRVYARGELLCQVLLNLLLNARRAMKDTGGTLTITAVPVGDRAQIDVRDTGRGIPRDRLEQVLNPFLAADPDRRPGDWQEVGLGLSVCRLIAHRHGATIQAFANEEGGCTFRLCWPLAGPSDVGPPGRC